jgi:hypothetical protein
MTNHYIFNFLLFLLVIFFQTYFGITVSLSSFLNIALIFLIFTFFDFSPYYLFFLIFLTSIILDTFSGFFWGIHLILLVLCFGIGILLMKFFEKSYFFPRLIIGNIIIAIYFLSFLILNLILKTPSFYLIILEQFIFTLIGYIIFSFALEKLKA